MHATRPTHLILFPFTAVMRDIQWLLRFTDDDAPDQAYIRNFLHLPITFSYIHSPFNTLFCINLYLGCTVPSARQMKLHSHVRTSFQTANGKLKEYETNIGYQCHMQVI